MSLSAVYTLAATRIPDLFAKIRDGQAPETLSRQLLKDWGFASSNDRAFIPILKSIGFLSADGKPTSKYLDYRDHSRSKEVLGQALREAYSDIFLIKEHPNESDKESIVGKFKSFHNVNDNLAQLMYRTFSEMLKLADISKQNKQTKRSIEQPNPDTPIFEATNNGQSQKSNHSPYISGLHYNIQIHLPATKDVEVYNAIFKSLKEHLIEP